MVNPSPNLSPIALLATGDELAFGDIVNSNGQAMARRLFENGIKVGLQVVAPDNKNSIEHTLHFLLDAHDAIIMTGGLGPTSDDLTRYGLAAAVGQELIFDEATWQAILQRLQKLGTISPPATNRQQALFPREAIIIPNPNGTAAGCMIQHLGKWIFMLPGPPAECLPLFENVVLPHLIAQGFQQTFFHEKWLLFNVSEGKIAEELDALVTPYACSTGYRLAYPYVECKVHSLDADDFARVVKLVNSAIQPYLISDGKITASAALIHKLEGLETKIQIVDQATGGMLENTLKTPKTQAKLEFLPLTAATPATFAIHGLLEFWQPRPDCLHTSLSITHQDHTETFKLPIRDARVKLYAMEWACFQILRLLERH